MTTCARILLICAYLFPLAITPTGAHDVHWGTYRPHALISVRARVPHSPFFGIAWHRADDTDVRHLAEHPRLSYFGWSRHNGDNFGDHHAIDPDVNAIITSSFARNNEGDAWALRIRGEPLREARTKNRVSVVFYAAAGPEEDLPLTEETGREEEERPWGRMQVTNELDTEGLSSNVEIEGDAPAIEGKWKLVVQEPSVGSLEDEKDGREVRMSRLGRRRRRDVSGAWRERKLSRFHVAAPKEEPKSAWKIESKLQELLKEVKKEAEESMNEEEVHIESERADDSRRTSKGFSATLPNTADVDAPNIFVQRIVEVPFELEIIFAETSRRSEDDVAECFANLKGKRLDSILERRRAEFDKKFESTFKLVPLGELDKDHEEIGRKALANILGGIGYFYGSSIADYSSYNFGQGMKNIEVLPRVRLLTATPSRAGFPRGYLWDEGFHQLVIQRWDPALSRECIRSWYSAMQRSGWIPREQVLGTEARERFPAHVRHLMLQHPEIANPPTLLMPLRVFASMRDRNAVKTEESQSCRADKRSAQCGSSDDEEDSKFLSSIYSAVSRNYDWLRETQRGEVPGTFRWRGRSREQVGPEGHPHTLASGLDDFPRADEPDINETHVDLFSWVTWGSSALNDIFIASSSHAASPSPYAALRTELMATVQATGTNSAEMLCDSDGKSKVCHEGYVTLFPLLLGLLDEDDPRVGEMLEWLQDKNRLRSVAGIRSLSKSDAWFGKGDNYWTGPTWMPFNYLVLGALKTKYSRSGRFKSLADRVYKSLRSDVLSNVKRVHDDTGFLWEQYGEKGEGRRGKQFTGWTSIVLLIYGEIYDGIW